MAALLLADTVVTQLPSPAGLVRDRAGRPDEAGRAVVAEAVERSPWFLRLMESWRWTMPMWRSGLIASGRAGEDTGADTPAVLEHLLAQADTGLSPLRALIPPGLFDDADDYLDRLCADVIKGGVDPGIGMLVGAGLDRFAARHGLVAVRAGA